MHPNPEKRPRPPPRLKGRATRFRFWDKPQAAPRSLKRADHPWGVARARPGLTRPAPLAILASHHASPILGGGPSRPHDCSSAPTTAFRTAQSRPANACQPWARRACSWSTAEERAGAWPKRRRAAENARHTAFLTASAKKLTAP